MQQSNFTLINEPIEEEQISNNTSRSDTSTTDNIFDKRKTVSSWFTDEEVEDFDKHRIVDDTISHPYASNYSSPSSCSSSLYQEDLINTDSILIKNAWKSSSQRKRRESVSDVRQSKKRPFSMSVLPKQHAPSLSESKTRNQHRSNRRKYYSLQPLSQHEKNKLASLINDHDEAGGVHWDPHIDAFEILRAKITGITRSMQQFHVQELFQDEVLADERRKRLSIFPNTTISTPLHSVAKTNLVANRRFSLANLSAPDATNNSHRRIRSQSFIPSERGFEQEKEFLNNLINQDDKARSSEDEEDEDRLLTSPNLTALFLTTNNLISSRLDELAETASIKSNHEMDANEQLEWQKKFLSLVTRCIQQSEALESLSTDLLNAEHRVRELMLVKDTLHEQFQEREKQYEERIRECQEIAQQQLMMIDSLEELNADIDMKLETNKRELHRQEALKALDGRRHEEDEPDDTNKRWDFRKSVADLLHMDEKQDIIHKMRWEIGMYVGGGVGTGHIIHTFEDKLNGIDMMIAGTGSTSTSPNDYYQQMSSDDDQDSINNEHSVTISSNIQHIGLYQHNYIIHLSNQDRRTRFLLLPRSLWVPDDAATQCQFHTRKKRCPTQFTLFNRRHHCRKCGLVICQRHSANRLPLFHPSRIYSTTGQWSRVCDTCFYALIMQK